MIPRSNTIWQTQTWQQQLSNAISSRQELLDLLGLPAEANPSTELATPSFPIRVPRAFFERMEHSNPNDPLLLQVLNNIEETKQHSGFVNDPLSEQGEANPRPGIIHKYRGRVLLITTSGCAVNCRYCFRRHFPYSDNRNSLSDWQDSLRYIAANPDINEVILSGGDPLIATTEYISQLVDNIEKIPHITRLRIHSRVPIVLPARINEKLCKALSKQRLKTVMVIHCNHHQEIDENVCQAITTLKKHGVTLLNQSVLLANINDHVETLVKLSERLFSIGVLPYYLHLLDKVAGSAHFDVDEEFAKQLAGQMSAHLPGYLVPKLAREEAGKPAKTVLQAVF